MNTKEIKVFDPFNAEEYSFSVHDKNEFGRLNNIYKRF